MFNEKYESVKSKLSELSSEVEALGAEHTEELAASYTKGFDDGKASVTTGEDKIYSQAELDAAVNPLKEEVTALTGKIEQLGNEQAAAITAAVNAAVSKLKSDLKAKFAESQATESAAEAEFAKTLDEVIPEPETPTEPTPVEPTPEAPTQE